MDGRMVIETTALSDIIESGMRHTWDFNHLRLQVALWLKNRGCYALGTDRVGETSFVILVSYWDIAGIKRIDSFDEWPSYTKARPITTW